MMQDIRLAMRSLRLTPLITAVAILSLALGIGANTAIFSIFDSLLLRKLPVDDPDLGVVANAVERRLIDSAEPVRYVAAAQMPWIDQAQSLVLRAAPGVDEVALLEPARRAIARVAPGAAVQQTTTMRRVLDTAVGQARQVVLLLSMLTALALTLSAVGTYGVIAHFAARRRRDWAIRVALGLPGSRVIVHVLGHGALLVTTGIGVGVLGATLLARSLSSFLYGVSEFDLGAFTAVGAVARGRHGGRVHPGVARRDDRRGPRAAGTVAPARDTQRVLRVQGDESLPGLPELPVKMPL